MVVTAEGVKPVENGDVGLGPVVAVIELQVVRGLGAALGGTGGIEPLQRASLVCGGLAAEMRHAEQLFALCQDGSNKRVAVVEQVLYRGDRDRSVANEIAGLAVGGEAS